VEALSSGQGRAEIVRRAAAISEREPEFINYLVELMIETKCLHTARTATFVAEMQPLADFYGSLGDDPSGELEKLSAVRPVLVVPARFESEALSVFSTAGIPAEIIAAAPGSSCRSVLDQMASVLMKDSILVSWGFPYRLPMARHINDFAIDNKKPCLFGACEGIIGRVGPFVVPGNSSCLECLNKRFLTHAGAHEAQAYEEYRIRFADKVPSEWPVHPVFHDAVFRLFVIELARILGKYPPRTIGNLIELSYSENSLIHYPVYRVPRCEGCGSESPQRIPWEVRFSAPMVKDGSV
jgi:bacteriocin biosynthesis cyclodehydratase domain-containing protein